jgi:hypothetical protein
MGDLTFIIKNDLQTGLCFLRGSEDDDWFYLDDETQRLVLSITDMMNPWGG